MLKSPSEHVNSEIIFAEDLPECSATYIVYPVHLSTGQNIVSGTVCAADKIACCTNLAVILYFCYLCL